MSRLSSSRRQVHAELAPRKGGGGYEYKRVVKRIEPDYSASDLTLEEYQAEISQRVRS